MRELFSMWRYTQMITAFVVSAGLYAALLFVFAALPIWIIPGVTAVRPGNAIPPFTSLIFGPAAAWGSAVGNLIGFDILGGALTIGSIGGFIGNFFLGLVPYKIWHRVFREEPHCRTLSSLLKYEFVILVHSGVVALIIPYWTELVGFLPFTFLAFIIFFNELISAGIIAPVLMALVYPRAKRVGWLWTDVMKGYQYTPTQVKSHHKLGTLLVFIAGVVGVWVTMFVGVGLGQPLMQFAPVFAGAPLLTVGGVFILIFAIGMALLSKD
ncbi:MAG: QueT transporter family protein [Thaumarchaeota archaeon]|nr:QueT transporter family protein [Candidatus Calditenuaceae archaeon]MDW8042133.1 QueT transporter family protein [Nitrososphaerota archaeon]